jgi:hypothetical protein
MDSSYLWSVPHVVILLIRRQKSQKYYLREIQIMKLNSYFKREIKNLEDYIEELSARVESAKKELPLEKEKLNKKVSDIKLLNIPEHFIKHIYDNEIIVDKNYGEKFKDYEYYFDGFDYGDPRLGGVNFFNAVKVGKTTYKICTFFIELYKVVPSKKNDNTYFCSFTKKYSTLSQYTSKEVINKIDVEIMDTLNKNSFIVSPGRHMPKHINALRVF